MYNQLKLISALNIKILSWHWLYKINPTSLYLLIYPTIVLSQTWIEQPLSLLYCASCVRDTAALRAQPTCTIMKWNSKPNRALQSTLLHTIMVPSSQEFHVEYQQWRFCLSSFPLFDQVLRFQPCLFKRKVMNVTIFTLYWFSSFFLYFI